jgi:formylglycine-generating enzyme required for sulfatase activity
VTEPPPDTTRFIALPQGSHRPLFPSSPAETEVVVERFELARTPVTHREFLQFVRLHPEWRRDRVSSLFADGQYLAHWTGPTEIDEASAARPVTLVSWFAAKAYCEARGARLPTELEWDRAAAASATAADGRKDPKWSQAILDWYSAPSTGPERDVGQARPNFWGVHDLTGLVWEWVLDFNSTLITSDSRNTQATDKTTFCGGGALGAQDPANYAGFMRIAYLGSLQARYAAKHLGFRCARDASKERP